jgi:hypothetical protein
LLACLRISPHSLEELSHGLMLPVRQVAPIVKELVASGAIRQLETDREGGPFYTPACYVEPADRLDNCEASAILLADASNS